MKKILLFAVTIFLLIMSCSNEEADSTPVTDNTDDTGSITDTSTAIDSSGYSVSVASTAGTYNADDIVSNVTFIYTINIDFSANTAQYSTDSAQTITTSGISPLAGITISTDSDGIVITSTAADKIKYNLSGTLNGTLSVDSISDYELYMNEATITATAGPALILESAEKVFIVTADDTTNTLSDSLTRNLTMKGAVYCDSKLIFSGAGTLQLNYNYRHGILVDDYLRICEGTINIDSNNASARNGISVTNAFIFDDGSLTINASGNKLGDESKGIKVNGDDDSLDGYGADKGYVVINGGKITINSVSKAITAGWDIDEDTGAYTSGNPNPYVEINNGIITLTTTGTVDDNDSDGYTLSPEGIEGKSTLTINNGYLVINSTDDGLNASGGTLTINDGYIYIKATANDGIDSNGDLIINGGFMVINGEGLDHAAGSFDSGDGYAFKINGGTFVGIAYNTGRPTSCTQNTVVLGSLATGTMAIKASDGTTVFSFTIPQSYGTMILSSPDIVAGTSYTIYTNGTASADYKFYGLYLDDISYSGGNTNSSFTAISGITKLGGDYF